VRLPEPLEAAIVKAPDDPAGYLVAGDWLQGRGAPQGELAAVMRSLEHERDPGRFVVARKRRDELLRLHAPSLLGGAVLDEVRWRWGFVSHARLEVSQLGALLSSDAGRVVRELEVHGRLDDLSAQLERTTPSALSGLALVGARGRTAAFQLAPALARLRLERLALVEVAADLTGVVVPGLRALHLRDVRHPSVAPFLAGLDAPQVRALTLQLDTPLEQKTALVGRLPGLVSLALEDDLADELARWAARAAVIKQLESLTLCGPMTDVGLDALLIEAARLSRLRALRLDGGHFGQRLKRLAWRQLPAMVFNARRAPWSFW
jgi:uncharacterized protein (TIGR02996 family)